MYPNKGMPENHFTPGNYDLKQKIDIMEEVLNMTEHNNKFQVLLIITNNKYGHIFIPCRSLAYSKDSPKTIKLLG